MKIRKNLVDRALSNWRELNAVISELREDEVMLALKTEMESDEPRTTVVERLKSRMVAIRTDSLREELDGE